MKLACSLHNAAHHHFMADELAFTKSKKVSFYELMLHRKGESPDWTQVIGRKPT